MATFVADLDDSDRQARAVLHGQLRARRELLGWSQRKTAERIGVDTTSVRRRERVGVDQAYAATVLRWARALGLRLVMDPVGFPPTPEEDVDDMLAAIGRELSPATSAAWQTVAVMHHLVRVRIGCQVTQRQLGEVFGISDQAVVLVETSAAALVVLQRHARGIARCAGLAGAHLSVHLEPDTDVV